MIMLDSSSEANKFIREMYRYYANLSRKYARDHIKCLISCSMISSSPLPVQYMIVIYVIVSMRLAIRNKGSAMGRRRTKPDSKPLPYTEQTNAIDDSTPRLALAPLKRPVIGSQSNIQKIELIVKPIWEYEESTTINAVVLMSTVPALPKVRASGSVVALIRLRMPKLSLRCLIPVVTDANACGINRAESPVASMP